MAETKRNNFLCGSCKASFVRDLEYAVMVRDTRLLQCFVDEREKNPGLLGDDRKVACVCGNVDSISLVQLGN